MKAKVLEYGQYGHVVEVFQDPENKNHFYEFGENGRTISDYDISDLEFITEDCQENQFVIYNKVWVVRNRTGSLMMFTSEPPIRDNRNGRWDGFSGFYILSKFPGIDLGMFDGLTWEDDPVKVNLQIMVPLD